MLKPSSRTSTKTGRAGQENDAGCRHEGEGLVMTVARADVVSEQRP
jgi:hypothetical protein